MGGRIDQFSLINSLLHLGRKDDEQHLLGQLSIVHGTWNGNLSPDDCANWQEHCGSGPGGWVFSTEAEPFLDTTRDLVVQLQEWVEHEVAPDTIVGTKYFNDTGPGIVFQRPVCPYPMEAVWTGAGQWQDPTTWKCSNYCAPDIPLNTQG